MDLMREYGDVADTLLHHVTVVCDEPGNQHFHRMVSQYLLED